MNASRPVEDVLEETTPLLLAAESQGSGDGVGAKTPTPLPKGQISILMLLGLAEPITALCIYPFINQVCAVFDRFLRRLTDHHALQLITDLDITGGDERKVGYYAGMIVSSQRR